MSYRLGIDTGGTFTDFVAIDEEGKVTLVKTESTYERPAEAIRNGIELLSRDVGLSSQAFLEQCHLIILGTTVATNALIQQKYAKTGMMCTKGFRDILEIRQGHKEKRYDWLYRQPPVIVPRYLRLPVEERIIADGEIYVPLNKDDVIKNVEKLKKEEVECVAVCFLWSFANSVHENMVGEILKTELPQVHVCLSSEVLPEIGDYNRVSTTALNACLMPVVTKYVDEAESFLRSMGYTHKICYSQVNAGVTLGDIAKRKPVALLVSGPSQGPGAGLYMGQLHGHQNVITVDMGGTSFDTTIIENGVVETVRSSDIQGYRVGIPAVMIKTIGSGGGSIAWIDTGGLLHVGPQSTEAVPGPACYDKGGEKPTVTDANVILGYLNPVFLLGGRFPINYELALRAIEQKIARPLGMSVEQASLGIFNLVNSNMMNGIREISIERGRDTRNFVLVVGGGSGPIHAGRIATGMEIPEVLIPKVASVFCAFGSMLADIKHDYTASYNVKFSELNVDRLNQLLEEMEAHGYEELSLEGFPRDSVQTLRTLYIRYVGQAWDCPVIIPNHKITEQSLSEIEEAFHGVHRQLYTFDDRKSESELVTVGVTSSAKQTQLKPVALAYGGKEPKAEAKRGERRAFFEEYGEYVKTPVFDGDKIEAGNIIKGPAIIEEATTTLVVFPGWRLELDGYGVYMMTTKGVG